MSTDLEERLRRALREDAERTPAPPLPPPDLRRRVRRRVSLRAGASLLTVALVATAAVVAVRQTGHETPRPPAGTAPCTTWTAVDAPAADPGQFDTYLHSVAAPAADEALAVGIHRVPGEGGDSFLELQRWDGSAWSRLPAPRPLDYGEGPSLYAVAAVAPDDAFAVGLTNVERGGIPLVLHWDRANWFLSAVDPSGQPESHLFGVTALGPDDVWAVGGWAWPGRMHGGGLVTHWGGTQWTTTALPITERLPGERANPYDILNGVAGSSGADVWAVGVQTDVPVTFQRTLVEHWDGVSWERVPSPSVEQPGGGGPVDSSLAAVTAISPDDAWAVGSWRPAWDEAIALPEPLALHWDGTEWTRVPVPDLRYGGTLSGIAAQGPDDVWAVGSAPKDSPAEGGSPLLLHWDGSAWSRVDAPVQTPGGLQAVTAIPGGGMWAVGAQDDGARARPLVLRCS